MRSSDKQLLLVAIFCVVGLSLAMYIWAPAAGSRHPHALSDSRRFTQGFGAGDNSPDAIGVLNPYYSGVGSVTVSSVFIVTTVALCLVALLPH